MVWPSFGLQAIVLQQFQPAWDLQAYLRFAGLSYQLENVAYPSFEASGALPQIKHADRLVDHRKAMTYLMRVVRKAKGTRVADSALSPKERAEAVAFAAMLQDTLRNALVSGQTSHRPVFCHRLYL